MNRNDLYPQIPTTLGPKVERPKPTPPEWCATGSPGIEINAQGQRRTNMEPPPIARPDIVIYDPCAWPFPTGNLGF